MTNRRTNDFDSFINANPNKMHSPRNLPLNVNNFNTLPNPTHEKSQRHVYLFGYIDLQIESVILVNLWSVLQILTGILCQDQNKKIKMKQVETTIVPVKIIL